MVVHRKLTAESLVEVPKRSPVVPNHSGEYGLYNVSTHRIGEGTTKEVRVMHFATGQSHQISDDAAVHDACWIPGSNDVIYLRSTDDGRTQVRYVKNLGSEVCDIADFDGSLSNLKLKALSNGSIVFMVAALADRDGMLFNEKGHKKSDSGRLFKTVRVRIVSIPFGECRNTLLINTVERIISRRALQPFLQCAATKQ